MQEEIVPMTQNMEALRTKLIKLGMDEPQTVRLLTKYLQNIETEKQNLISEVRRLSEESKRLQCEFADTQQKLRTSEELNKQLQEGKGHLGIVASTRQCDPVAPNVPKDTPVVDRASVAKNIRARSAISSTAPSQFAKQVKVGKMQVIAKLNDVMRLVDKHVRQGHHEKAVQVCKQTLEGLEKSFGHVHRHVATMLIKLARVYQDQKRYTEAANLLNDALAIREKTHGEDHPVVAEVLSILASVYEEGPIYEFKERHEKAEPLWARVLEIHEKELNCNLSGDKKELEENVAHAVNELAFCYMFQSEWKEAEILCKQVLNRAHEREFGAINDDNKPIWLVAEEQEENMKKKNIPYHEYKLDGCPEVKKVDSPTFKEALGTLAFVYEEQGKFDIKDCLRELAKHDSTAKTSTIRPLSTKTDSSEGCVIM